MDVSKVCRSCMKEVTSWERENFTPTSVENMFSYCTNIKITNEDKLPRQFCCDCIVKIESSFTFISEAQKVNVTLKNILSRATSVIVKPESSTTDKVTINSTKLTLPEYKLSTTESYHEPHVKQICYKTDRDIKPVEEIKDENVPEQNGGPEEGNCEKQVCPVCRKAFTSKTWLAKHIEKDHTRPMYSCSICGKTFTKLSQLKNHSTTHSDERTYICSIPNCGKSFKRKKDLTNHTRRHDDFRPYVCDLCSMRFKEKNVLKGHMKVHEDSKEFVCDHCGWSFAQAGNLKVHMRIHTGERPFSCSDCGFRSATASNLRRHQRTHSASASHVCNTCRKAFNDASALGRHMRTHTGELPYQCPSCPRAFADSWKRKTHLMRSHHVALQDIPRMRRDGMPVSSADNRTVPTAPRRKLEGYNKEEG